MAEELKTVTIADAADITNECELLVSDFLEKRGFVVTGASSYPQTISHSRFALNVDVDIEKFRRPHQVNPEGCALPSTSEFGSESNDNSR
jgi:hypothetical protein